ncbi:MAG: hypothetical protein QW156_04380 [Candidatus Aenigmatarchaeota archaeon]
MAERENIKEEEVFEVEELERFRFYPDLYAHIILRKMIDKFPEALANGNEKQGIMIVLTCVDLLKTILKSMGWFDGYSEVLNKKISEIENNAKNVDLIHQLELSKMKLEELLTQLFKRRWKRVDLQL